MQVFQHMELNTNDPEAAKRFYSAVFGWTYDSFDMGNGSVYWLPKVPGADQPFGGLQRMPMPDVPSHWLGYITVPSVRGATDKVKAGGGQVVLDYQAIPGMGAFGVCIDPQGAAFAVWESHRPPEPPKAAKKAAPKAAKKAAKKATAKKAAPKKAAKKPAKKAAKKAAKKKAKK